MRKMIMRVMLLCVAASLCVSMTACDGRLSGGLSSDAASSTSVSSKDDISSESSSEDQKIEYTEEEWRLHPEDFKLLAFTFDDGPEAKKVDARYPSVRLADLFVEYNGKATFFLVGKNLAANGAEIPKYILSKGHEIANHSYDHVDTDTMKAMTPEQLRHEIVGCNTLIEDMLGVTPKFFRGGGYSRSPEMWELLREMKMPAIYSYKGFGDNPDRGRTAEEITNYLLNTDLPDGAIIGMHTSNVLSVTPDGLAEALPKLYEKGYRFCTLSELFEFRGVKYEQIPKGCYISRIGVDPMGDPDVRGQYYS